MEVENVPWERERVWNLLEESVIRPRRGEYGASGSTLFEEWVDRCREIFDVCFMPSLNFGDPLAQHCLKTLGCAMLREFRVVLLEEMIRIYGTDPGEPSPWDYERQT